MADEIQAVGVEDLPVMGKGVAFAGVDDPRLPSTAMAKWRRMAVRAGQTPEEVGQAIIAEYNERWAIVGSCPHGDRELVAGELEPHIMSSHVSARARSVARALLELPAELRAEVVALFGADGAFRPEVKP